MIYNKYTDLVRRTAWKYYVTKDLELLVVQNMVNIKEGWELASMIYKFFDKKSAARADIAKESRTKNNFKPTPQLADELHKSIIRKFERHKLYSSFIDNIWGTDLDDMELSWYNKGTCFFICAIDVWSKYECVVPFKDKSDETINKAFQKMIKYSNCRPKKI